jgi:presenilin 1
MSNLIDDPSPLTTTPTLDANTSPANVDVVIRPAAAVPPPEPEDNDDDEDEIVLKYGASHVVKLFIPVTICLLFVIISLSFVTSYQESGGATLYLKTTTFIYPTRS